MVAQGRKFAFKEAYLYMLTNKQVPRSSINREIAALLSLLVSEYKNRRKAKECRNGKFSLKGKPLPGSNYFVSLGR